MDSKTNILNHSKVTPVISLNGINNLYEGFYEIYVGWRSQL